MPLLPPPTARPQDRPLREDVRRLASALGRVIARLEGQATFEAAKARKAEAEAARLHEEAIKAAFRLAEQEWLDAMNQRAEDLMMQAPSSPANEQLRELGLRIIPTE